MATGGHHRCLHVETAPAGWRFEPRAWTRPIASRPYLSASAKRFSFSTTFQRRTPIVARIVEALGGLPVRAVVTCGPAIKPSQRRDQREVAARAVWHGAGMSTTARISAARLRCLIRMALDDSSLRVAARQLAARMAADEPDIAVRELE